MGGQVVENQGRSNAGEEVIQLASEVDRERQSHPIVISIEQIQRHDQSFRPVTSPDGRALLGITFKTLTQEEVRQLLEEGMKKRRSIEITDGRNRLPSATVAGPVLFQNGQETVLRGPILCFGSTADGLEAAERLKEDPWKALDRHLADPNSWR